MTRWLRNTLKFGLPAALLLFVGFVIGSANSSHPTMSAPLTPFAKPTAIVRAESPTIIASTALPINGNLDVVFIDVGQGDSIFVRTPNGQSALIDGGPSNGKALTYLQSQGINHLDLVILTHPHADHVGGLVAVLQTIAVDSVWTSGASNTTSVFERFIDMIAAKKIPYNEASTGQSIPLGDLKFDVLFSQSKSSNLNNTSLVLHLNYRDVSFLFTGDAETPVEQQILSSSRAKLAATVLKVGHHGSYTSSSPDFLAAVAPRIAIYSAGANNSYGHPHDVTI